MFCKKIGLAAALALIGLQTQPAWALDLLSAYRLAVDNDATYQVARSTAEASREALPQARAGLLPNIGLGLSQSQNSTEQTALNLRNKPHVNYDYTAKSYALTLRQPLFRMGNYYQYRQAEAQVAAAEETLSKEYQSLMVRVSGTYFDTLTALERLNAIRSQIEFLDSQYAMTQRAFTAGIGTRTDIEEAKARLDIAKAQEIEATNGVKVAERNLGAVLGQKVNALELQRVDPATMRYEEVQLAPLEQWLTEAEAHNPELAAMRSTVEVADREVDKARSGHMPTVDLILSRSLSSSENNATIGNEYKTDSVGVQLNVPLYAGGGVQSAVRQAIANRERARFQLEAGRRQLEVNVTKEFSNVEQGVARIKAREQALVSAQQALKATEKGVQAGTRNNVDVLNARQQLTSAQLDLAQARHEFAQSSLQLRAAAGLLAENDIMGVNGWLSAR